MRSRDPRTLVDQLLSGERAVLPRLISLVERGGAAAHEVGRLTHPHGGRAYTVGITGAPGAGKSTLTDKLIAAVRATGQEVAVLAIDPSSPFTGGAILGDRVRMQDHATDPGVFIRSMATRGHLGGLSLATPQAVRVLDAAGFPVILIETVGVGQIEVEVAGTADSTLVVVNPGWGDAVQANKAGLLEVADLFVVNKADRPGARETQRDLEQMLELTAHRDWRPPIVHTVAAHGTGAEPLPDTEDGSGVPELWSAVSEHRSYLESSGALERRRAQRVHEELREIVLRRIEADAWSRTTGDDFDRLTKAVVDRALDPWSAADQILSSDD